MATTEQTIKTAGEAPGTPRLKFVFLSYCASPHQVRLYGHLQRFFETEFWFYEHIPETRPGWWRIPLPDGCTVFDKVWFKKQARYVVPGLTRRLRQANPDVLMIGGFFLPSNYLAYRWAKRNSKRVIISTESFRTKSGLRGLSPLTRVVDYVYREVDAVLAHNEAAADQMRRVLPHLGSRTHFAQYPADIDGYFDHSERTPRSGYVYLFANRLIPEYNPLLAIEIFADIARRYPTSRLRLNRQGPLYPECVAAVERHGLACSVEFLADIRAWDEMPLVYRDADILLLPATFSNGNYTVLEAMASGMGIVVSDRVLWPTPLIRSGENGYVCEPEKGPFLSAVQAYIDHPEQFGCHARINREIARPLSCEGTARLYAKLVREISGQPVRL